VEEIKERCISKKEYLEKYDSNVGYALYVQDNIKKDDYARLNVGEIVRVIEIRENQVNKKAIYFGIYDDDWCDSAAVENFSENIIDLIEVGDYVNGEEVIDFYLDYYGENNSKHIRYGVITKYSNRYGNTLYIKQEQIKSILTHEQYNANCYKIDTKITNLI